LFGADQGVLVIEVAKQDRAVVDGEAPVVGLGDANRLSDEGLAEEDEGTGPSDLAVVANATDLMIGGMVRLAEAAVPGPRPLELAKRDRAARMSGPP
jgi:hypothetical protein